MEAGAKKVLVMDDEPDITYIIEFLLTNAGFEVTRLNDSMKAVDELTKKKYDLLILDLMMPKLDGFTLLKNIREHAGLKDQHVLILSSRQLTRDETTLLATLSAEVMAKPFEPHRLLEKVREVIA